MSAGELLPDAQWSGKEGKGYDYLGLFFSQFLNWRRHDKKRWFCSELIAAMLALPNPQSYSPGDLKLIVERINQVHQKQEASHV